MRGIASRLLLLAGALASPLSGQDPSLPGAGPPDDLLEEVPLLRIVSGVFSRLEVFGTLDATFGGVGLDRIGEVWGFSGAFMVGRGSEGGMWVHLPLAGLIAGVAVLLPLSVVQDLWFEGTDDEEDGLPGFPFELLAYENVHRNVPVGERVLLSPYLGVLGLDGKEGDDLEGFMSLNSGMGLNVKLFAGDRFVVAPDVSLRYHWILRDPTSDDRSRFGVTASLRAGFIL